MKNLVNWICESDEVEWLKEWMNEWMGNRASGGVLYHHHLCKRQVSFWQSFCDSSSYVAVPEAFESIWPRRSSFTFLLAKVQPLAPLMKRRRNREESPQHLGPPFQVIHSFFASMKPRFLWDNCNVEQSSVGWRVGEQRINILENQVY